MKTPGGEPSRFLHCSPQSLAIEQLAERSHFRLVEDRLLLIAIAPVLPMLRRSSISFLVSLWFAWVVILLGYQAIAVSRYSIVRPDTVLPWTARDTQPNSADRSLLNDPILPPQVAWDSEFYLAIALYGYDAPMVRTIQPPAGTPPPFDRPLSLNYAFFPVYPLLIRWVSLPLRALGWSPIISAAIAGMLVSIVGTLAAMVALWDLARPKLGEAGGLRAAFYLIVFPTGFFLAQVYTEGLFLGLAFSSLALGRRQQWVAAAGLATIATLTKAVGVGLMLSLIWEWVSVQGHLNPRIIPKRSLGQGLMLLLPAIVLWLWKQSFWGGAFRIVEQQYFQCEALALNRAALAWWQALQALWGPNPATRVYFAIEFAALILGGVACLTTWRREPGLTLFGLVVLLLSSTCGVAQGMHRYVLAVPSLWLALSRWGAEPLVDRVWSLLSILLLGLLTALFSFDFWVG